MMRKDWTVLAWMALWAGSWGCGASSGGLPAAATTSGTFEVGETGGAVTLPGGPIVDVPAGALTQTVSLGVQRSPSPGPATALSPVYAFTPDGVQFGSPVTVRIPVPSGTTAASVYWTKPGSTTAYEALPAVVAGGYAIAQVTHFSAGFAGATCVEGGSCTLANGCHVGAESCSTGTPVCVDTGASRPDGTVCGTGQACRGGSCVPAPTMRTIGGSASGILGRGLVLRNNGGDELGVAQDGSFVFAVGVPDGAAYEVTVASQPSSPDQTCTVTNGAGTVDGANVTRVAVSCVTPTYTVGGTVTGLATGASVVLQDGGGNDLAVTRNGAFTFTSPVAGGMPYAVTVRTQPTSPIQVCTVRNGSGTVPGGNVTDVEVACVTDAHLLGGTVTGLQGSGLRLRNNGGDDLVVAADGAFTFPAPVPMGSPFAVTVEAQPVSPAQACSVANGTGVMGPGDVRDVTVTCRTSTYSVGGTVTGLLGSGLRLRNNGGDDLVVAADGAFTFPTLLASGSSFAVTVVEQPGDPAQTCRVTHGTGSVPTWDIRDVAVTCTRMNVITPVLFVPRDQAIPAGAERAAIEAALRDVQDWYRTRLGNGALRFDPVQTVLGARTAAEYLAGDAIWGEGFIETEAALGYGRWTPGHVVVIMGVGLMGWAGGNANGTAGQAVLGLESLINGAACAGQWWCDGAFWRGTFIHELGHALTLPHSVDPSIMSFHGDYQARRLLNTGTYPETNTIRDLPFFDLALGRFQPNWTSCTTDTDCRTMRCGCNGGTERVCLPNEDYPVACFASAPVIESFTASPQTIPLQVGDFGPMRFSTLSWTVRGATDVAIAGVDAGSGTSATVNPYSTTTYTLRASNANGESLAQATVYVNPVTASVAPSNVIVGDWSPDGSGTTAVHCSYTVRLANGGPEVANVHGRYYNWNGGGWTSTASPFEVTVQGHSAWEQNFSATVTIPASVPSWTYQERWVYTVPGNTQDTFEALGPLITCVRPNGV